MKPDVYAAANTKLPDQLFEEGLVEKPVRFAGNRLVIAVPAGSGRHRRSRTWARGRASSPSAPSRCPWATTRARCSRACRADERKAILANVRSEEPDVAGIVGKLTQGAADAGFLYITDVIAAGDEVRAIELPAELQPSVEYGVAVVKGAKEPEAAQEFIDGLLAGAGAEAMREAGFEPPPK